MTSWRIYLKKAKLTKREERIMVSRGSGMRKTGRYWSKSINFKKIINGYKLSVITWVSSGYVKYSIISNTVFKNICFVVFGR